MKRLFLAFLFIDFALFTGYALFVTGLSPAYDLLASGNIWVYQVCADLMIALGISVAWMINHARARGISWVPYLVLTLLGSIGPLLYAAVHASGPARSPAKQITAASPSPAVA